MDGKQVFLSFKIDGEMYYLVVKHGLVQLVNPEEVWGDDGSQDIGLWEIDTDNNHGKGPYGYHPLSQGYLARGDTGMAVLVPKSAGIEPLLMFRLLSMPGVSGDAVVKKKTSMQGLYPTLWCLGFYPSGSTSVETFMIGKAEKSGMQVVFDAAAQSQSNWLQEEVY
jgi:hypothetical protein